MAEINDAQKSSLQLIEDAKNTIIKAGDGLTFFQFKKAIEQALIASEDCFIKLPIQNS
jgi:hypothetical protein